MRYRQGKSIADKTADRLQLSGHHGDDLASCGPVEMVQRKTQHSLVKLVTQTAEHTLANLPLLYVEMQLEPAIQQHKNKKDGAQQYQIRDLSEFNTKILFRKFFARNSLINYFFGQI